MELQKGDIIQITDQADKWFPALLVVDDVKHWGVQAYAHLPTPDGPPVNLAYYRIENKKFEKVGEVIFDTDPLDD